MATTLLDNLNSDLFDAFSAMLPKGTPERVLVYVESDADIAFWRDILTPFEQKKVAFEINLPTRQNFEKGKTAVLEFANSTGSNLILAVDSDYDYLLQSTTETAALINQNPYIFQTYAYSIENLKCYAPCLHSVCVQSSMNDQRIINFEDLLSLYSQIIYPLFLWSVYFALKQDSTSFSVSDFSGSIKILGNVEVQDKFVALIGVKNRVEEKLNALKTDFPNDAEQVAALSEELKHLGVEATNVYLFAQGHTIMDNVVLMFLNKIFTLLRKEKVRKIKEIANATQQTNNINQYIKQTNTPIRTVLDKNTEYKSCFLYQKIKADLDGYMQQHFSSQN